MKENPKRISLSAKLRDKFSDHGLVTVISGMALDDTVLIDLWLMSCGVFKRDLEFTIMNNFVKKSLTNNIKKIIGIYIPTTKIIIVKDLYKNLGFSHINTDENLSQDIITYIKNKWELNNTELWELAVSEYKEFNTQISLA